MVLEFVAGHSLLASVGDSNLFEPLLTAAERAAVRNRKPKASDASLRLSVRRNIRKLWNTTLAYEIERKRFVLALRMKDQAFARLIAPPAQAAPLDSTVLDLIGHETAISVSENRLVALWTSFQVGRLDLYRQLATFPYNDWKSFYAQFQAQRGDGGKDAKQVLSLPQPAPEPGGRRLSRSRPLLAPSAEAEAVRSLHGR